MYSWHQLLVLLLQRRYGYHMSNIIQSQVQLSLHTPRSQDESNKVRKVHKCVQCEMEQEFIPRPLRMKWGWDDQEIKTLVLVFHMLAEYGWVTFTLSMLWSAACLLSTSWTKRKGPLQRCKKLSIYNHLKVLSTEKDVHECTDLVQARWKNEGNVMSQDFPRLLRISKQKDMMQSTLCTNANPPHDECPQSAKP